MAINIDSTGINIDTLDQRIEELNTDMKVIYGDDINLDQDTPDGQMVGIHSKLDIDIQEAVAQVYDSRDPDTAQGVSLASIMKLAGLTPNPATKSTVNLDITTLENNITLTTGYTIADDLSQNWIIDVETLIATAGTQSVSFIAENFGAVEAQAGTITAPVTIIIGVDTVTNPLAATIGLDEETDPEARVRRNKSVEKPARSSIGSILGSLFNDVDNVVDAIVYENDTDIDDVVLPLTARTIWAIVEGGTDADIAEVLAKQKTLGAGFKGSVTANFSENITKPDGNIRVVNNEVKFDRPNLINIFINVTLTKRQPTDVIDEQAVKNSLIQRIYSINEDGIVTDLYANVYAGGTNFTASALELSDDDITFEPVILEAGADTKFVITDANINITVV